MLSRALLDAGLVERVTVVTERLPGQPSESAEGALRVIRLFPCRAGGVFPAPMQYVRYLVQNLLCLRLPALIKSEGVDVLLVHSSFHNHANLLGFAIAGIPRRVRLIADVRDMEVPLHRLVHLEAYDRIIACSDNVTEHLRRHEPLADRIESIPVPQEPLHIPDSPGNFELVNGMGLEPQRYILFAGLLKAAKGVDFLLDAYLHYRKDEAAPLDLALAGVPKSRALAERARNIPGVHVLGEVERTRLLVLMKYAALNVNLSGMESVGRVCLEALALGTRAILPAGVPEFQRHCPRWVAASSTDPEIVAEQFRVALRSPPCTDYPLENHRLQEILPRYGDLIRGIASEAASSATPDWQPVAK